MSTTASVVHQLRLHPLFRAGVSTKRTLAWFPETGTDVNVTVVVTTPGADYTSLKSFGTAQDFGSNLVASMDRSFTQKKGKPLTDDVRCKHFLSVFPHTDGAAGQAPPGHAPEPNLLAHAQL